MDDKTDIEKRIAQQLEYQEETIDVVCGEAGIDAGRMFDPEKDISVTNTKLRMMLVKAWHFGYMQGISDLDERVNKAIDTLMSDRDA